jgi:hypothetical protein
LSEKVTGLYYRMCLLWKTYCLDYKVSVWGDNHCGYMGFRQPKPFDSMLKDDGAINVVVAEWRAQTK